MVTASKLDNEYEWRRDQLELNGCRFTYHWKYKDPANQRVKIVQKSKYYEKIGELYYKDNLNSFFASSWI